MLMKTEAISPLRRKWAKIISRSWHSACRQSVKAFIQTGTELIDAKEEIVAQKGHGEWIAFIGSSKSKGDLPFGRVVAQKLMNVARDTFLSKSSHESFLPPDYNTLYGLAQLHRRFPDVFDKWVKQGTITPSLQRGDISKTLRLEKVQTDQKRILNLEPITGRFRTIVIDPAWDYEWLSLAARAKPGYAMQTIEQLELLDVRAWADEEEGCHLYCWATNNFLSQATRLVQGWGFQHRTVLTWIKPNFGLGSYFRNSTEQVLFATLGDTKTRPAAASIPTHFEAPRGEHSEKPEKFYEIVRKASYPPYGEANQREPRPDFVNLFQEKSDGVKVRPGQRMAEADA
jgi:N6-adenosine-specific RNA methylase IME4